MKYELLIISVYTPESTKKGGISACLIIKRLIIKVPHAV